MKFIWSFSLLCISVWSFGQTQPTADQPAFENEIRAFEKADSTSPPPRNAIVFTGSSSIRLWENLSEYFPNKTILNRGFGGSKLPDVLRYADRIIIPYQPKQIVLYAGENDVAAGQTGQQTYESFVALFEHVRQKLPNVPFTFISLKPSPSRRKVFPEMDKANQLINDYLRKQRNTEFVDIRPVMLTPGGQPVPELFKSDSLHMLPAGYQRWASVLRPYLK
ncbi:GDSL-type esterase/lipase family protein [Spirosoma sp. KNUC1025]|uniref:GDSL-type esterase/lipase family protein n=1 Tax=Spirosoma sp. KNUC1025 TaxID=2894082 RepID=UPI00386E10C7|nr:GDSL-type esterase/lipase family protein [Spirosoma sp. KNUC1025]